MFFCEICEIFKNTYFEGHLPTTASDNNAKAQMNIKKADCSSITNII